MSLFDYYIMVDWSGGNSRRCNRNDCIWLAYGASDQPAPACESHPSRTETTRRVAELLNEVVRSGKRALACFDFAFGYPRGFAAHLPTNAPAVPLWKAVWTYLANCLTDNIGTKPGRRPTNRSNRFEVANDLNGMIGEPSRQGPFWCAEPNWRRRRGAAGLPVCIPQEMPAQLFVSSRGEQIPASRLADQVVQADYVFRLFGNGSVGSQAITGIPRLHELRATPGLASISAVWPFETGWAPAVSGDGWLTGIQIVLAEIYPSVRKPLEDDVRDRGQVRAMWHWARDLDRTNALLARFARPPAVTPGDEQAVITEEGWVLH